MLDTLEITNKQNINKYYNQVKNCILRFLDEKYDILRKGAGKELRDDANDYVVYKTLKIIKNYKKYRPIFNYLSKKAFSMRF